jgi:hypothetical protein
MTKPDYDKIKKSQSLPTPMADFDPFAAPEARPIVSPPPITEPPIQASVDTAESSTAPDVAATDKRPLFFAEVNREERRVGVGYLMYPSRQEQLNDIAYLERRKPWEIIDQALEEYVKRHYGKRKP